MQPPVKKYGYIYGGGKEVRQVSVSLSMYRVGGRRPGKAGVLSYFANKYFTGCFMLTLPCVLWYSNSLKGRLAEALSLGLWQQGERLRDTAPRIREEEFVLYSPRTLSFFTYCPCISGGSRGEVYRTRGLCRSVNARRFDSLNENVK